MNLKKLKSLSVEEQKAFFSDFDKVEKLVRKTLSAKRANHSVSVAKTAKMLAAANGVDENKAYLAGLLHDITKENDVSFQRDILNEYEPKKLKYPVGTYHSYTAAYYLKDLEPVIGADVIDAIYNHTIVENRTPLNMILFIADKREPLRKIDDDILDIACTDLNKAYEQLCVDVESYLTKRGKDERIIKTGL